MGQTPAFQYCSDDRMQIKAKAWNSVVDPARPPNTNFP